MSDLDLYHQQKAWADMIRSAQPPKCLNCGAPLKAGQTCKRCFTGPRRERRTLQPLPALEETREETVWDRPVLQEGQRLDKNGTGLGECRCCHEVRPLWNYVCAWCGADPEDLEGE